MNPPLVGQVDLVLLFERTVGTQGKSFGCRSACTWCPRGAGKAGDSSEMSARTRKQVSRPPRPSDLPQLRAANSIAFKPLDRALDRPQRGPSAR
jgi:hypothetical protein